MPKPESQQMKKGQKKKLPTAPLGNPNSAANQNKVKKSAMFEKRSRSFRIGGDLQPVRDLTRYTKWPQYIRLQRQKRILLQRLKVPPSIAQFQHTLSKDQVQRLQRLCKKIAPESKLEKKQRLTALAGGKGQSTPVPVIKYGINHVCELVEQQKAKLVIIAHDVDPVEIVCWLPALCRKKDVPYCVIKSKARLGAMCGQKTCAAAAITSVPKEDEAEMKAFASSMNEAFNQNKTTFRQWGGGIMGRKSSHIEGRKQALIEREKAKKAGIQ